MTKISLPIIILALTVVIILNNMVPKAHAAGYGMGESAYRMANALERIATALEKENK